MVQSWCMGGRGVHVARALKWRSDSHWNRLGLLLPRAWEGLDDLLALLLVPCCIIFIMLKVMLRITWSKVIKRVLSLRNICSHVGSSVILQKSVETADHLQPLLCCLQIAELALVALLIFVLLTAPLCSSLPLLFLSPLVSCLENSLSISVGIAFVICLCSLQLSLFDGVCLML